MNSKLAISIVVLTLLFASYAFAQPATCDATTPCGCGYELVGSRTLNESDELVGCAGNGLLIATDDVTLDCAGYSIVGSNAYNGIDISASNVVIANCLISNFSNGVYLNYEAENDTIIGNTLTYNEYGIMASMGSDYWLKVQHNTIAYGSTGLYLYQTVQDDIIENNTIHDMSQDGIYMSWLDNPLVTKNTIYIVDRFAIYMSNIEQGTIEQNDLHDVYYGINVVDSDEITIQDNAIESTGLQGIYIDGSGESDHNILRNNLSFTCGDGSNTCAAIELEDEDNCLIQDNNIWENYYHGIMLVTSNHNKVLTNTILDNGWGGIIITSPYSAEFGGYNNVSGNTLDSNRLGIATKTEGNRFTDNTITSDTEGTYLYGIDLRCTGGSVPEDNYLSGNDVSGYQYGLNVWSGVYNFTVDDDEYHDNIYGVYINGVGGEGETPLITDSQVYANCIGAYATGNSQLEIADTDFYDNNPDAASFMCEGSYGLYADYGSHLDVYNGDFINNGYDNDEGPDPYGMYDNSGFTINWHVTEPVYCINNSIYVWGTINGFGNIAAENCPLFIEENEVTFCGGSYGDCGCGDTVIGNIMLTGDLECSDSDGLIIGADGVTVDCNSSAISLGGIIPLSAQGFDIQTMGYTGILNDGYDGMTVRNCDIHGWQTGIAAYDSQGHLIEQNDIYLNGVERTAMSGIHFENVLSSKIDDNEIYDNDWGIYILDSDSIKITDNEVYDNWYSGIYIDGSGTELRSNHVITGNEVIGNAFECSDGCGGIELAYEDNCLIHGNTVVDNGNNGISLSESFENRIINNYLSYNNNWEIRVAGHNEMNEGGDNIISGNIVNGTYGYGGIVAGTPRNVITDNTIICDNMESKGINVFSCWFAPEGNYVSGNDVSECDYGLFASGYGWCSGDGYPFSDLVVDNNDYYNNNYGMYLEDLYGVSPVDESHSGSHAWWSHDDYGGQETWITRTIDLTDATNASFDFWAWFNTESCCDYGSFEIYTDGWSGLETFSDVNEEWTFYSIDLTAYVGDTLDIRFYFYGDGSVNYKGVVLDDFALVVDESTVWSDDVESGDSGWDLTTEYGSSWSIETFPMQVVGTTLSDNNIYNNYIGLYADDCYLITESNDNIHDNCVGVDLEWVEDYTMSDTDFNDNQNCGLVLESLGYSGESQEKSFPARITKLGFNTQSQFEAMAEVPEATGLYSYNSHINLLNGDFINNGDYGIYEYYSIGTIEWVVTKDVLCKDNDIWIEEGFIIPLGGVITPDNCTITVEGQEMNFSAGQVGTIGFDVDTVDNGSGIYVGTIGEPGYGIQAEIYTNSSASGSIDINFYNQYPVGSGFALEELGLWVDVTVDPTIEDNLSFWILKIYYTDEEVAAAGLTESSLEIQYYNNNTGQWESFAEGGVNTAENYVWAKITHFSIFGIFGSLLPSGGSSPVVMKGGGSPFIMKGLVPSYFDITSDLESGQPVTKTLSFADKVKFTLDGQEHMVQVVKTINGGVEVQIQSTSFRTIINEGETANFDFNNDDVYDLALTLARLGKYSVDLTFQKISVSKGDAQPEAQPADKPAESAAKPSEPAKADQLKDALAPVSEKIRDYRALWMILAVLLLAGALVLYFHRKEHHGLLKEIDQEMKKLKK
ncbi:right-handed parallel beta-helix repeat-containing protein [Candidatus Woesearchaeota archaeon]|nr:right-handed parallel beta-helix repeat-containing protein [Candidatus Woesearchaeota archaeon]